MQRPEEGVRCLPEVYTLLFIVIFVVAVTIVIVETVSLPEPETPILVNWSPVSSWEQTVFTPSAGITGMHGQA